MTQKSPEQKRDKGGGVGGIWCPTLSLPNFQWLRSLVRAGERGPGPASFQEVVCMECGHHLPLVFSRPQTFTRPLPHVPPHAPELAGIEVPAGGGGPMDTRHRPPSLPNS